MSAPAEQYNPETGEVLDEDAPDTGGWDRDRHCATDLRGVDWAGRKFREAEEQLAIQGELATDECLRIDEEAKRKRDAVWARLAKADAPFKKTADFMENAIRAFAQTHRAELMKGLPKDRKSRILPTSGVTVAYRTSREQIEVTDAEGVWSWSQGAGREVARDEIFPTRPPPTAAEWLSKKGLNKVLSTVKSEVPGVKRTPGVEEVQVWTDLSKEEGK